MNAFQNAIVALLVASASVATFAAERPVRIGELNSYAAQPSFLIPYRNGWRLALKEVNEAGGLLQRRVEVISRDDLGTPGDDVRVAESLLSRHQVELIFGTFLSNVGLAVADFAKQRKVVFLAAERLSDPSRRFFQAWAG